jgi:Ca-activated chloride channel homolog
MTRTLSIRETGSAADPSPEATAGGRLVTSDGRALPLVAVRLSAEARGGLCRSVLVQVFENPHPEPLQVSYLFPLPHGGAVSGFSYQLGDRRVVGEVELSARARERFEEAVLSGRSAALVDQHRGSLFTQELGNVPPGARVEAELVVDQRLDWRAEGAWEWRFPTAVAPRYQGAPGRVPDAGRTVVEVAAGSTPPRLSVSLLVRDPLAPGRRPECPSHPLAFAAEGGLLRAALPEGALAQLDRDLVVRWPAAAPEVGVSLDAFRASGGRLGQRAFGLLTVVPPVPGARAPALPRDLVLLLDVSGSMSGPPLDQARHVAGALVDTLGDEDQLELIAFGNAPLRWRRGAVRATAARRREAHAWLARLQAGGGTEMREGIREALRGLRADAQRQVVLVTDGLIGFEAEVVAEILATLPAGSRVHTVGVGPAVNRSLTGPAARAGRGLEVVIGPGEDPERAAAALCARTAAPLVTNLAVEGSAVVAHAPARLPDLFAGAPVLVPLELAPAGGTLRIRGLTAEGHFERTLQLAALAGGAGSPAAAALFGREAVEDLELRLAAGEPQGPLDRTVERIGLDFQLSTRLTSWVAVSEEVTVDPTRPVRRERVPQELAHGLSVEGLGLRPAAPFAGAPAVLRAALASPPAGPAMKAFELARSRAVGGAADKAKKGAPVQEEKEDEGARWDFFAQEALVHADADAAATGPAQVLRLAARRRAAGERRLVLEAVAGAPGLEWEPPARARVRLADGAEVELELDLAATTAAASLAAGTSLRVVLGLPEAIAAGQVVEVELLLASGLRVVLTVEA